MAGYQTCTFASTPRAVIRSLFTARLWCPEWGGRSRVYVEAQQRKFSKLADADLIDTADLCRLFGCSTRTVYRWVERNGLGSAGKVGREFLFTKGEVVRWFN